jgi:hypothetical protein
VEPPVSYLKSTVLTTVCEMTIVFGSADCAYFIASYLFNPISSATFSFLRHFLRPTTPMAKEKITGDELKARAKANSY